MATAWPRDPFEALTLAFTGMCRAIPAFRVVPVEGGGEMTCAASPFPIALFNRVMGVRLAPDAVDRVIERVHAIHDQAGVPGSWWLDPATQPADFPRALIRHGYDPTEEVPGMAMALDGLPPLDDPPGVTLSWVTGSERMREVQRMVALGFGIPAGMSREFGKQLAPMGDSPDGPVRVVVAEIDGETVGAALAATTGDVAGIYNVMTLPQARGRGVGRATTLAVLHDARERGAAMAVLEASAMGFGVYERIGFQHVGDFRVFG